VVDQHAARGQPGERAVVALGDAADVVVIADAHEHELECSRAIWLGVRDGIRNWLGWASGPRNAMKIGAAE
jgi:hypothetical protein